MHLLTVDHMSGGYNRREVLHDLNFTVDAGEIVGLIGLNGAGKSTTIKHIIGLLNPTAGAIQLNGQTLADDAEAYHRQLSYIPEVPILYEELTLREHLQLIGQVYDIAETELMQRAEPLLEAFRLRERLDWLPVHFSKGMKQKVMIICSLVIDAALFVIDEPFIGLDPLATHDFIELIEAKKAAGKGVLMSTHVLANAEQYCDRFIFLDNGRITADGSLQEIQTQLNLPGQSLDAIYLSLARR